MSSYKSTVHLPTTDFPMKAGLAQKEPQQCAMWEAQDIYRKIRDEKKGRTRFVLNDGPPYANGHLHCGHALNKILKDMVVKSKTMSGYDAPFVPGWDCHGLPIELHVEKKLGKVSKELSPKDFRAACRAYAESQIKIQLQEFQRLGVFGEWNNPYKTMDFSYEADVVRALAKIIKNGYVYRGEKPVHWCIACGSALAEAEVEYEDKVSSSIDVAFEVVDSSAFLQHTGIKENKSAKPVIVPIWTTTPWTLPANEAVCLHPEFMYGLVETEKAYYLILMDLMDSVLQRYDIQEHQLLGTFSGTHFEHILVRHPLYAERQVPIVLGMHVSTDAGTGAVHTAPAHGVEDYMVGLAYKLPFYNPVNTKGCYKADVPVFAGVSVLKANELVLAHLQERNTLLYATSLQHSYPHCWRHKTPMIFLATSQWFIAMDRSSNGQALLRSQILDNLDKVNFIPDWGKPRMMGMIEGRPDWCVSRQRMWGTPIPLFIHKETQELHPDTLALLDKVADAIEEKGVEAWFDLDVSAFLGADADSYMQVKDTLDVWFDAGISHYAVLQARADLAYPADLYLEGSDQYRGWFNSSVSTAVAMNGTAPYKAVLTHGYTVDSEGKKLSKSKGNYVALEDVINRYGADVLRLWVASTDYRYEVSISEEIMTRIAEAYRRIRNTSRFLLANLHGFDPAKDSISENFVYLDALILQRAKALQDEIIQAYDNFQFHVIYQKIYHFCTVDLGSFYLDVIKDRQYTLAEDALARRSCQTAMYHVLQALSRWIAPILSFTAEEIWRHLPQSTTSESSIFLSEWYQAWPTLGAIAEGRWDEWQRVRETVNKALELARQNAIIGSGLAASVHIAAAEPYYSALQELGDELRFLCITSQATLVPLTDGANYTVFEPSLKIGVMVEPSPYEKCERCWHKVAEVGEDASHPSLCPRCIGNITSQSEERVFI